MPLGVHVPVSESSIGRIATSIWVDLHRRVFGRTGRKQLYCRVFVSTGQEPPLADHDVMLRESATGTVYRYQDRE